ncbi:MAG: phasin family protein [Alphaproteobacteria bacterium]
MTSAGKDYEIPVEMRDFAERSVQQAKKAVDGFMTAAHRAVDTMENSADVIQNGATTVGRMAVDFAEANLAASFDFAQKLVRAADANEMMKLQAEFLTAQMTVLQNQATQMGATIVTKASGSGKASG